MFRCSVWFISTAGRPFIALVILFSCGSLFAQQADAVGQWSSLPSWYCNGVDSVPTHATLIPTRKVLYFSSYDDGAQPQLWDPASLMVSPASAPGYSVFCSGHSALANGNLLITGGHIHHYVGVVQTVVYNPFTNRLTRVPDMNAGRWYPTNTTLANGDVLVVSGTTTSAGSFNTLPQVFEAASGRWRDLSSAVLQQPLYPFMFLAPNGRVFSAGPNATSRYLDTANTGSWSFVARTNYSTRSYGSAVMYEPGKILIMGGGGEFSGQPTASAEMIDLNSSAPAWRYAASMRYRRRQHNATLLPDGTVLVTGGTSAGGFDNPALPVNAAEIWDPTKNLWSTMASNTIYRGYHSFALLLPDGRVLSAGGQRAGCAVDVFSPRYLFKGSRPRISSAPSSVAFAQRAFVGTPDAASITRVSWVRLGSVTHGFDMDQRFLWLSFSKVSGGVNVNFPANGNLSPPGYYMLFLLNNLGVPSHARIVRIYGSATKGTISGRVTNISTNKPLSGASVSYSGGATTTNSNGDYWFLNVAPGSYSVTASRSGFSTRTFTANVTANNTATLNFPLATKGVLAGRVTNTSGAPIGGATVTVSGGVIANTTMVKTNSAGDYRTPWIVIGNYSVTVSATNFASRTNSAAVSTGVTTTLNFTLQ